jgi:ornithine cyclodeaminase
MIDAATVQARLGFPRLIAALRAAFIAGAEVPLRHRHAPIPGASLLLMPAWQAGGYMGVKIVSVFPANSALGLGSVASTYLLCDGRTGHHLALMDGNEITGRRTAAASALAADDLARPDSSHLLVVGAGHIASMLPAAFAAVRPIRQVTLWNHRPERAEALVAAWRAQGIDASVAPDLEAAVRAADIVSCATLSTTPLIHGEWLSPGTHLDLIGGFTPTMREADDTAIARSDVYIDTDAALTEAGDITQPIAAGILTPGAIKGTLATLARKQTPGRSQPGAITLFKSVGSAIEDIAAAALVYAGTDSSVG